MLNIYYHQVLFLFLKNLSLKNLSLFILLIEKIIFKLEQSTNNIQTKVKIIEDIINLAFIERIKFIIKSTNHFIKDFNKFYLRLLIFT